MPVADSTLRRGLVLLTQLAGVEHGRTVSELAALTGFERSQVSRTMGTLTDLGAVARDPRSRAYRLSWSIYALAAAAGDQALLAAARPVIDRLAAVTGSPAHLTVLDGTEVITVASGFPPFFTERRNPIGERSPAWCTSSGRTLLAGLDDDTLRKRLARVELVASGPHAPCTVDEVIERAAATRGIGAVVVVDEFAPGLMGVAAPVHRPDGTVIAALNISGPTWRLAGAVDTLRSAVDGAARELDAALAA
jgi:DNA-binding IclR family transcriptional regulator